MTSGPTDPGVASPLVHHPQHKSRQEMMRLALGALGVVYGDIGTSPLYALRECFSGPHSTLPTHANVMGVLSLFFWSLTLVVSVKYLTLVMRADNRGEGGILALLALLVFNGGDVKSSRRRLILILLGIFGAALLLADGMITPAISVLSAIEGISLATPALAEWVIPITVVILVGLFSIQKHGTGRIAGAYGPMMLIWFTALAAMGLPWIFVAPRVLLAVNPYYAIEIFIRDPQHAFMLLGSVVLCVTGAEALYADMGHFGRWPIRFSWYVLVFPALLINYFGQGAVIMLRGEAVIENPFYRLVPPWMLYPMVGLAAAATIIASQALISGAYSLAQQAVQLGYCPRLTIVHTSYNVIGQIYLPSINTILMIASIMLVLYFGSSSALAAAYGIAVVGSMSITSILLFNLVRLRWNWPPWMLLLLTPFLLLTDIPFLVGNISKIPSGGWVPLVIAAVIMFLMITWFRGKRMLVDPMYSAAFPLRLFLDDIDRTKPIRVQGTAVFMTSRADVVPSSLLHHFKHNQVLHERVILLTVQTRLVPKVAESEAIQIKVLQHGFYSVTAYHGFMEDPDVPAILRRCAPLGLEIDPRVVSYYLGRVTLLTSGKARMNQWQKRIFSFMYRNERAATSFFNLPANRVVEMGRQLEL